MFRHSRTFLVWHRPRLVRRLCAIFQYALDAYTLRMYYSFDPAKNAENLRKHGLSLAEGDGVLGDPLAITIEDDSSIGEKRWVTLGTNFLGALRVVVWALRGGLVRIISVRRAEPSERRTYEESV